MTTLYRDSDGDLSHLRNRQVAILGYGNLGRPFALNLRDQGIHAIIGNQPDEYAERAQADGFTVYPLSAATAQANILMLTLPDEVMPQLYLEQIAPFLKRQDMLIFASGFNIAFNFIEPPVYVDVGLIAPRTLAATIRQSFLDNTGYPIFIALHQKMSEDAMEHLLAFAKGVGGLKQWALEVTIKQEVELDLFSQQAILPALHALLLTAAQILVKSGYPEEATLMELYLSGEMGEIFQQAAQQGFVEMLRGMSMTGQYGILSRTERFQETKLMLQMESILDSIKGGNFAREWTSEFIDGYPRMNAARRRLENAALWKLEEKVNQMMGGKRGSNNS